MKLSRIVWLFLEVMVATSIVVAQDEQNLSDEIKQRPVAGIDLNQVTEVDAFSRALQAAHVAGGIATLTTCGEQKRFLIVPKGPTLQDVLDAIVAANPGHRWYVNQGAVNLVASKNTLPLLDMMITDFNVEATQTLDEIIRQISEAPEVQRGIARLHLSQGFNEVGLSSLERPGFNATKTRGFALRLHNVTVRQALNTVALAYGNAVWSYQESRCNGSNEFVFSLLVQ